MLHKILANPYYKGEVRFQGVVYPGRHEAIVDPITWQRVQDLMSARVVGEKVRVHHMYLKSTLVCGQCEHRFLVQHPKNRHGVVCDYFVCSGRHTQRNGCEQSALPIATVESKVVELYRHLQLDEDTRTLVARHLRGELERGSEQARQTQMQLVREQARLDARIRKLLEGHLDGTIPAELYREEQQRISQTLTSILERLSSLQVRFEALEANLDGALELLSSC